jgi:thioredoxin-like negative regulator of GroEL
MSTRSIYGLRKQYEFEEVVKKHNYVIVKAEADWCGPCQSMKPLFVKLVNELPTSVAIVIINIDQSPELKRKFRIQSVPLLFNVINTEVQDMVNSANPSDVESFFKKTANRIS